MTSRSTQESRRKQSIYTAAACLEDQACKRWLISQPMPIVPGFGREEPAQCHVGQDPLQGPTRQGRGRSLCYLRRIEWCVAVVLRTTRKSG